MLLLAVPACAGVLLSGPAQGAGSGPAAAERALLAAPAHGKAAVQALGDDLDVAASRGGLSAGRLRELLTSDTSAWVDRSGRLFYVDRDHADPVDAAAPATEAAAFPYADSFRLHSRPNATRKVFLDFDGHQVSDTAWNDASHPVIDVAAYTRDGSAALLRRRARRGAGGLGPGRRGLRAVQHRRDDRGPGHRRAGPELRRGRGLRHAGLDHH